MPGEGVGGIHLLAEHSNRVVVRAPVNVTVHVRRFHRITLSQKRRKFPQQDRIASAACSVAVIRIEPAGFSRRSVMAIKPSLDLLKAQAYRL